ncbi:MAG: 6-bladed beta-propeller [Gemmatimonadota bacterium]|jgi:hypothetical protein
MFRTRSRITLALSTFVLLTTACQPGTPAPATVRDSAGIEIVESSAPLLGPDAWTVSVEPVLQIGEVEGEEEYLLSGVPFDSKTGYGGTFRMPDGRIVITDKVERTARIFDAQGKYLSRFGREGEGPGEFSTQLRFCFWDGEHIAVVQSRRISIFDTEGRFLERFDPETRAEVYGFFPDRAVLIHRAVRDPRMAGSGMPGGEFPEGVNDGVGTVSIVNVDGSPSEWTDTIVDSRWVLSKEGDYPISTAQPFAPRLVLRPVGGEFVYGWGDEYDLRVFGRDGDLKRIIRQIGDLTPVTAEDEEWFTDALFEAMGGGVDARNMGAGLVFPDQKAAFDRFLFDRMGYYWVGIPAPVSELAGVLSPSPYWDVFDPSGRWVTTMKLPSDVQVHEIGEDYILGVWKDEFGVEFVRMYSLDRGG